jgi:hypothetical protein
MMRKLQLWASALFLVTAIALSPFFVGCEDEPGGVNVDNTFAQNDTENQEREDGLVPLSIDPLLASISYVGERIALRAKGAVLPVTWSPANYDAATVTVVGPRSDYAVFKATQLLPNAVLAVDAAGRTATADITIGGSVNALQITPNDATIPAAPAVDVIHFVVTGGSPPYVQWESAFHDLGTIDTDGTYDSTGALIGTNIITVVDSVGDTASATVGHL